MTQKIYNYVTGGIFAVISILHLVRSILGWPAVIGGMAIPTGASVLGFLVAFFLCYSAFRLSRPKAAGQNSNQM